MSAKEYREYEDECMRSAKNSTVVKECSEFLKTRKHGFRPLTFWRPNPGARLLYNLIPLLDLPAAASSNKTRFNSLVRG